MIDFACKRFDLNEIVKCAFGLTKSDFKILKLLMFKDSFLTSLNVQKELNLDLSTAQRSLKKLRQKELILRKQKNLSSGGYVFEYKAKNKNEIKNMILNIVEAWTKKVKDELEKF
jgi:predicted transcriptional regulator